MSDQFQNQLNALGCKSNQLTLGNTVTSGYANTLIGGCYQGGANPIYQQTPSFTYYPPIMTGSKYIVVCNGTLHGEFDTLDEAQTKAEQVAHQYQGDAFILKPSRKVSPKRDVVTTELP